MKVWGEFKECGVAVRWVQNKWEYDDGYDEHVVTKSYISGEEWEKDDWIDEYKITGARAYARASDRFHELVMQEVK